MKNIGIVGFGTIGGELGPYLAKHGAAVYGVDVNSNARKRATLSRSFAKIFGNINKLPASLDAVIEATPEILTLKSRILTKINEKVNKNTYILLTSSTIPTSTFIEYVDNPERLMNAHILPDLRTRKFIELQGPGPKYTNQVLLKNVEKRFSKFGFNVAIVNGESEGFIFNRIWHGVMLTVFNLMKYYDHKDIDYSCAKHFEWRYGPVMAMDLIGYDTLYNVFSLVMEKQGEKVPSRIKEMKEDRTLGLKSGKGFYEYKSHDLDGLHKAAEDFMSSYSSTLIPDIATNIWNTIRTIANTLLENGQTKKEIQKAIRYGFPIEKYDPFE